MSIKSFIRFVDEHGNTTYGEPAIASLSRPLEGTKVKTLSGDPFNGLSKTGDEASVAQVKPSRSIVLSSLLKVHSSSALLSQLRSFFASG